MLLQITLLPATTDTEVEEIKDQIKKSGGKIGHEYTLFKGFSVTMPEIHAASFADHPRVQTVEKDQEVRTQFA
ncbi:hypothetical protein EV426DRAFT_603668 [Tirmania nivea]|nr:hypothetical protein EV426DRAFT_603668 [Tirmania nivea]